MPDALINGNFQVVGPVNAVPPTAEDDARAAAKVAAAKASRVARRAAAQTEAPGSLESDAMALTDATGPVAEGPAASETPEPQPAAEPDADQAAAQAAQAQEVAELIARADALGLRDRYTFDAGTSVKWLRTKVQDAQIEARQEAQPAAPVVVPDDAELEAAREVWREAEARHHALQAEYAGLPGRIEDVIASGDYPQVLALRQRKTVLPFAIATAELDATKCKLRYYQLRVPRARAAKVAARLASAEVNEAFEQWKRKTYEAASAAVEAAQAPDDATRDLGAIQRELDRLMSEMAG